MGQSMVSPDAIRKRNTCKNHTFIGHIVYCEGMINIFQFLRWKQQSEFSGIVM